MNFPQVYQLFYKLDVKILAKYNDANHLIFALNNHKKSLEKQLNKKQIIIETLLQNIHKCSKSKIVANSNHKADKVSFENLNSYEKSKMISNKSNPADDDDSQTTVRIISTIIRKLVKQKMNNL